MGQLHLSKACWELWYSSRRGPITRYEKLRVAHAPGMTGTISPPPQVSDPDMHHGTCVTHVPWCTPGTLTSSFLWIRWRGKRSRRSRRTHNSQFYVSSKRPMGHETVHRCCDGGSPTLRGEVESKTGNRWLSTDLLEEQSKMSASSISVTKYGYGRT